MTEKRCRTCRFMEARVGTGRSGFYKCEGVMHKGDAPADALAQVGDAEDYSAWLEVKPEFGCVLHEEKEDVRR